MAQQKQIKEEIGINKDFKLLTRSYQEHAIGQINFARFSVLGSREFALDLEEVFSNVRASYNTGVIKKTIKKLIKKNGKDIWVLITANNKLYGELLQKTTRFFIDKLKDADLNKIDLVIIGRQGKNIFDQSKIEKEYKYFELPDVHVSPELLKDVCNTFLSYENVIVFYGKFNNIISQSPIEESLSGEIAEKETDSKNNDTKIEDNAKQHFLFEPSIEEILIFFESQILSLLMNQAVQESQLARFASRISAMETAQNNIQKQLNILDKQEKVLKNMDANKKQLELLAGRSLWTRK